MWFAWKIVPLWYQQQQHHKEQFRALVVICLKNCTFVVSTTTQRIVQQTRQRLWFAWKIVPLWYQQQLQSLLSETEDSCDLLEKLYLCGINNNSTIITRNLLWVVICLKNCTFVVSTTTIIFKSCLILSLWFAWKIVPLWYQQQRKHQGVLVADSCDLLEKLYLCGINNNLVGTLQYRPYVVICLKNCTFVVSTTTR